MEKNSKSTLKPALPAPLMSLSELAQLGDGKVDGQLRPGHNLCLACGRNNRASAVRCLYCQAELPNPGPFLR